MSNLRLFEPRRFEPALSDPFESMFKRFMAPMQTEFENGALDMRLDVDGVLTPELPKKASTASKRISIQ